MAIFNVLRYAEYCNNVYCNLSLCFYLILFIFFCHKMRLSSILSGKPYNSQSDISLQLNGLKLPITCNFISFRKFGITKALSFQKEELLFYLKCVINNHESHDFVLIYGVFFIMLFSCCRLRQVQALLCGSGTAIPDGILCSLGMLSQKLWCVSC